MLFIQFLGFLVSAITVIFNYLSVKSNNRNTQQLELTKQEFARENEKLKHEQAVQNEKQKLISNFLSSINVFKTNLNFDTQKQAISSCSKLLPLVTDQQEKIIVELMKKINVSNLAIWDDKDIAEVDAAIDHATQQFLLSLKTE